MSNSISSEFLGLVADAQAAVDQAEFFSDWTPPGSPSGSSYASLLKGLKTGAGENKKGERRVWISLEWEILQGEHQGRTFNTFFSTDRAFLMGELFNLAAMAENDPTIIATKQLLPAVEALSKHVGAIIVDVISKTKNAEGGKVYTNQSFDRIIDRVTN